jgi:hypothetical protein
LGNTKEIGRKKGTQKSRKDQGRHHFFGNRSIGLKNPWKHDNTGRDNPDGGQLVWTQQFHSLFHDDERASPGEAENDEQDPFHAK